MGLRHHAIAQAGGLRTALTLDPLYVDVVIRRYAAATSHVVTLVETGEAFGELAARRASEYIRSAS
jgi:hypothetical protein